MHKKIKDDSARLSYNEPSNKRCGELRLNIERNTKYTALADEPLYAVAYWYKQSMHATFVSGRERTYSSEASYNLPWPTVRTSERKSL